MTGTGGRRPGGQGSMSLPADFQPATIELLEGARVIFLVGPNLPSLKHGFVRPSPGAALGARCARNRRLRHLDGPYRRGPRCAHGVSQRPEARRRSSTQGGGSAGDASSAAPRTRYCAGVTRENRHRRPSASSSACMVLTSSAENRSGPSGCEWAISTSSARRDQIASQRSRESGRAMGDSDASVQSTVSFAPMRKQTSRFRAPSRSPGCPFRSLRG